jgi:hypothetical protein
LQIQIPRTFIGGIQVAQRLQFFGRPWICSQQASVLTRLWLAHGA